MPSIAFFLLFVQLKRRLNGFGIHMTIDKGAREEESVQTESEDRFFISPILSSWSSMVIIGSGPLLCEQRREETRGKEGHYLE